MYIMYLKYSNSVNQRAEWWLPGVGEVGSCCSTGVKFQLYKMYQVLGLCRITLVPTVNDPVLYTLTFVKMVALLKFLLQKEESKLQ